MKIITYFYEKLGFKFTNTGTEELHLLVTKPPPDVKVEYPRTPVMPGKSGIVRVFIFPKSTGQFEKFIPIYSNAGNEPQYLKIKGNVTSVVDCPGNKNNRLSGKREVLVIDKHTGEPLPMANIEMLCNKSERISGMADENGKLIRELNIGLYDVSISKTGYNTLKKQFYLDKQLISLIFKLEPLKKPELVQEIAINETPLNEFQDTAIEVDADKTIAEAANEMLNTGEESAKPNTGDETPVLPVEKYAPNNIVFLLDISLSMRKQNKLELLKLSMTELVYALRSIDRVSVITYSNRANVEIVGITANIKDTIISFIDSLSPYGITNGVQGLETAYDIAHRYFIQHGNNQLIVATDGKFNGPDFSERTIRQIVRNQRARGIIISFMGLGRDEEAIDMIRDFADSGGGNFMHIYGGNYSKSLLINEIKRNSLIVEENN